VRSAALAAALGVIAVAGRAAAEEVPPPAGEEAAPAEVAPVEAAPAAAPAAQEPPFRTPDPSRPGITLRDRKLYEFSGGVEAGVRFVSGEGGRYEQDVNLDDGFRLLSLRFDAQAMERGLAVDDVSFRAHGLGGDPSRGGRLEVRRREAFDLVLTRDVSEFVHVASGGWHPFDTERSASAARLSIRATDAVTVRLGADALDRTGRSRLDALWRGTDPVAVDGPVDYRRRGYDAGIDARAGAFRFGVGYALSDADDDTPRFLRLPAKAGGYAGTFRTSSDVDTGTASAHAGVSLLGGDLDLVAAAFLRRARNRSTVDGSEVVPVDGGDGIPNSGDEIPTQLDTRGGSQARMREAEIRFDARVRPHADWDVLARVQRRSYDEAARYALGLRFTVPAPPLPGDPFSPSTGGADGDGVQDRYSLEATWRASKPLRFRAGAERILEDYSSGTDRVPRRSPRTVALTAGADWSPVRAFDASLLVRSARSGGAATRISLDAGETVTFRSRLRGNDGGHVSTFVRTRERREDDARSRVRADAMGVAGGIAGEKGFLEVTLQRHRFLLAADTRFVRDLAFGFTKEEARVRSDEEVDSLSVDFSREISGPLRVFGSARVARGRGDFRYDGRDASLGLGVRLSPSAELRCEGRGAAWREEGASTDDYRAKILTVSLAWEF
jgi:hypothetical protein